ncbi:cytochrome P450 [Kibdelosporangium banguiense]|uniref:Cytochrome P450 n=1 Tax=Kibdelosporangium banguiense TaxID=1365924 RepID=A0ABS4TFP8_9PSEU|nr:cytochrome P450 [Kibdelosporangium banguiense]MBP2323242.1 cytochrome P450 [Kibdelosporangium banguiense]
MTRNAKCPFDPPGDLSRIRDVSPLSRMKYPSGHVGWLATGRATVRSVLADSRFSARTELMNLPTPGATSAQPPPAEPGDFTGMDDPRHSRYRRLLTGQFTVRRMRTLTDRIEQITAQQLAEMDRTGPVVDLVQAFARPIPALMICELLGVPYDQREIFQHDAELITGSSDPTEELYAAYGRLQEFLRNLVLAKRAEPSDDILSGLVTSDLTDEELATIAVVLLGAGLGTTMNMLTMGTLAILQQPEQFEAMRENTDQAVEELLRYLTIVPFLVRVALEDVELDGHEIKAGETVTLSLQAANRDPAQFTAPDVLDVQRQSSGHVAFGHGVHQCLGQQLARIEMRVALRGLVDRFPDMRLAVPFEDLRVRADSLIFDVHELPVILR